MKRFHTKVFTFLMLIFACTGLANAQVTGRILDQSSSAPLSGVLVHLVSANLSYTTGNDGLFSFVPNGVLHSSIYRSLQEVTCANGFVSFCIASEEKNVTINIFDASGRQVAPSFSQTLSSGNYTFDALSAIKNAASGMLFIARVVLDGRAYSFKILSPAGVLQARSRNGLTSHATTSILAKRAVTFDSITATKTGYLAVALPISSYNVNLGDITMAPQTYALNVSCNPASGGTVNKNPNMQAYPYGTLVTLTATPSSGYTFANWTGSTTGTVSSMQIVVTNNMSVTANFTAVLPVTPTGLAVTTTTSTSISLSWNANGATSYQLFRNGVQVYTGIQTTYTDIGLASGTTYQYTVQATNSNGSSAQSSAVSGTTVATSQFCFWSNDGTDGNLTVYVDGFQAGTLSQYFLYPTIPAWNAAGTLVSTVQPGMHSISATSPTATWPANQVTVTPGEQLKYQFIVTQWCFWTNQSVGNISIYIDNVFMGTLTRYFTSTPSWNALGTIIVSTSAGAHTLYAHSTTGATWGPSTVSLVQGQQQIYELN
jgi:uncharacterized repeat protein (TIGR02543 family)